MAERLAAKCFQRSRCSSTLPSSRTLPTLESAWGPSKMSKIPLRALTAYYGLETCQAIATPSGPLTQAWIGSRFSGFLKPKDLLVIETGTSQTGLAGIRFPGDLQMFMQMILGSIGYANGAAVGVKREGSCSGMFWSHATDRCNSRFKRFQISRAVT